MAREAAACSEQGVGGGLGGRRTFTAACSAVSSASSAWRWLVLGEEGGEKVGEGDDGVGGSAVSRHTRRSISCNPRAAARVSRSSSAAESSPEAFPASSSRFWAWRLGDDGGEHVGDGERGVGGRLRSTTSCMAAPNPLAPSERKGKPRAEEEAAPETGDRACGMPAPDPLADGAAVDEDEPRADQPRGSMVAMRES